MAAAVAISFNFTNDCHDVQNEYVGREHEYANESTSELRDSVILISCIYGHIFYLKAYKFIYMPMTV